MKTKLILPLVTSAALALAIPGLYAEINPGIVPADSKWVVHADFAQLRDSAMGVEILAGVNEYQPLGGDSPFQPNLKAIMETIGSVTAFGDNLSGKEAEMDGALILEGTEKLRIIADGLIAHMLLSEPDKIEELTDLPFEAYRIQNEIVVGLPKEPIIVSSRSKERLLETMAVYRNQGKSLAKQSGPLSGMMPEAGGYYIFAASVVPSEEIEEGNSPQARILRMTQAASIRLGEQGEDVVANAILTADSKTTAERLAKIVNGLTALLSLAQSTEADLVGFIESVEVKQVDRTVTLQMAYPSLKLIELAQAQVNREAVENERRQNERSAQIKVMGELISEWRADADLGSADPVAACFTEHVSGTVTLESGSVIHIASRQTTSDRARLDYVDVVPAKGGAGERYEAEFMRLGNYVIERNEHASGGELVGLRNRASGRTQFRFGGASGEYIIKVGYVDENDGVADFKLSVVHASDQPAVE